MAHKEQQDYCISVKEKFPDKFKDCKVLDIGSLDINGNNRYLFTDYSYIGIDLGEGKNVDVVSYGHEYISKNKFDVVISTECLEHDFYYKETLKNAYKLLKKGGILLFTCATTGREQHGITNANPECSPFTNYYYSNLTIADIESVFDLEKQFSDYELKEVHNTMHDLYFYGIKK
jgi:SAM-dependent methyltransferase